MKNGLKVILQRLIYWLEDKKSLSESSTTESGHSPPFPELPPTDEPPPKSLRQALHDLGVPVDELDPPPTKDQIDGFLAKLYETEQTVEGSSSSPEDEDDEPCDCVTCRVSRGEVTSKDIVAADQVGGMFIFTLQMIEKHGYALTERVKCEHCGLATMITHATEESLSCPRCKHRVRSNCPAPVAQGEPSVWDYQQVLEELAERQPMLAAELNDRAKSLAGGSQ